MEGEKSRISKAGGGAPKRKAEGLTQKKTTITTIIFLGDEKERGDARENNSIGIGRN